MTAQDVETGDRVASLLVPGGVWSIAVRGDGKGVAYGAGRHGQILTGEIPLASQTLRELPGHTGTVISLAFSADGRTLISTAADDTFRVWDLQDAVEPQTWAREYGVTSVSFSPDSERAAVAGTGLISFIDLKTTRTLPGAGMDGATAPAHFLADGRLMTGGVSLLGGSSGHLWDVSGAHAKRVVSLGGGLFASAEIMAVDPHGDVCAVVAAAPPRTSVQLWSLKTGGRGHVLRGHTDEIRALAFTPDGQTLATGSGDETIRLWDAPTGRLIAVLNESESPSGGGMFGVSGLAFSPDGKTLASAVGFPLAEVPEGRVSLWDVASRRRRASLPDHDGPVSAVAFSADGRTLASGGRDATVRLWDAASTEFLLKLNGADAAIQTLEFRPDGGMLAAAARGKERSLSGAPRSPNEVNDRRRQDAVAAD